MRTWEIKHKITNNVLYQAEGDTLKEVVEKAVRDNANLADAYLVRANLTGAYLADANLADANLADAYLAGANLTGANLADANLADAYLVRANLTGANLADANLAGAYLADANLAGAYLADVNLAGAKNINKYLTTPLYMLLDQPEKIIAYKLVNQKNEGIYNGGLKYEMESIIEVSDANTDENESCGSGINVASLDWILREYKDSYKILIVEFTAKDIAAIPIGSNGKFRLHRCKVVGEKNLKELGLEKKE